MSKKSRPQKKPMQRPFGKFEVLFALCGVLLCISFAVVSLIGREFYYENEETLPIVSAISWYLIASVIAIVALALGLKTRFSKSQLLFCILVFAASFRAIQILSQPVLEVDLYRYMWDGIVTNEGISPYHYSPEEALTPVFSFEPPTDPDLVKIQNLAIRNETIHTIVQRVHFPEYSTIYPPVSQWVFAGAMWVARDDWSVESHVIWMKFILVLFDFATIILIWRTIGVIGFHPAWLIAYAWNPLVIKEVANSGHLDSIAIFFLVASVHLVVREFCRFGEEKRIHKRWIVVAALAIGLGVGAKIYPLILTPLLFVVIAKCNKKVAVLFAVLAIVFSAVVMFPMLVQNKLTRNLASSDNSEVTVHETKEGLSSFLTQWRMNDLVFSCIFENVKPDDERVANRPWYIVTSNRERVVWHRWLEEKGVSGSIPFKVARAVTVAIFFVLYLLLLVFWWRDPTVEKFLHTVFLVIALFFVLQPTQNPWYWVWAMPFVCFARNKGWLAMSAVLLVYYFRFWFESYQESVWFLGIEYRHEGIFDYLVVFWEYGIAGLFLVVFYFWQRWNHCQLAKRNPMS